MKTQIFNRLIANTLPSRDRSFRTVHRSLGIAAIASRPRAVDKSDPHALKERTVDHVVDRLLKELTW
jgi:hypothetical protein